MQFPCKYSYLDCALICLGRMFKTGFRDVGKTRRGNSFCHKRQEWETEWKGLKTEDFIFHEL